MSAPIDLALVRAFVAVHEGGSFSVAGERLGVPRSTVSRSIAALEERLGLRLFHRTTRKVVTTDAGRRLAARVASPLAQVDVALEEIAEQEEEPAGRVRVTTTVDLGAAVVAEAAARFVARYPRVQIETRLGIGIVDLVKDGVDLALRVVRGPLADSDLVAKKVGTIDLGLYAAPSYLARKGTPKRPSDLATHDFVGVPGTPPRLLPKGYSSTFRVASDDMFFLRAAVVGGAGLGYLTTYMAEDDVAKDRLVPVMAKHFVRTGNVYVVMPSRKNVPRRVTAFRDLLVEMLRERPLSPIRQK